MMYNTDPCERVPACFRLLGAEGSVPDGNAASDRVEDWKDGIRQKRFY